MNVKYLELAIVIGSSSGFGYLIKYVMDWWKERERMKRTNRFIDGLKGFANTYQSMDTLKEHQAIERVFLVELSNGGNMPKPGSKMYAKSVTVKHIDKAKEDTIFRSYESILIDDQYINMCVKIASDPQGYPHKINVEDEPASLLKDFYTTEGVKYSEVYHIFTDNKEKKMFILSIATSQSNEKFESEYVRALIHSEVTAIRTQFNNYRRG